MNFIIVLLICLVAPVNTFAQSLGTMVNEIATGIEASSDTKVAVLEFSYTDPKPSGGPTVVQERITTALVKKHIGTVVERRLLDRVMGELKLQRSGMFDEGTIKQLGKMLGVDYVVTGTLNDVSNTKTEVNARLINAENGKVISASSAEINKTWTDTIDQSPIAQPVPQESKDLTQTKDYMDGKLAELRKGVGTTIKPRQDGQLEVNGMVVSEDDFTNAVMKTLLNDTKAAGLKTPLMAQEEP
jgi:TolB-like protein